MGRPSETAYNRNKLYVFFQTDHHQIASWSVHIYNSMPSQRKKKTADVHC